MRRYRLCAALAAGFALLSQPAAAIAAEGPPKPRLDARSAIVVDAATGEALLARRASARRSIASTTKLMTALLALERARVTDVFAAPPYDPLPAESKIGLRAGERMTVRDLLVALMLESANDAAVALAENVAGSRASFVRAMNARADELGLRGTSFANPIGLDDPLNYSTARDLAVLTRHLMRNPLFARMVDRPRAVLRSGSRRRVVRNRNQLVARHRFVDGVKTGHTIRARYVLIGAGDKRDARVISVVLGEPSQGARDQDTLELLRWGLAQFRSVLAVRPGRAVAHASVADREGERVALVSREPVRVTVRRGERAESRVDAPGELEGPLPAGRRVGRVEVLHRGRVVGSAPLVTARAVPEVPALRRLEDALGAALTFALGFAILVAGLLALRRARPARARGEGAATGEP